MKFSPYIFYLVGLFGYLTPVHGDIAPNPMSGGISLQLPGNQNTDVVLEVNTVKLQIAPWLCKTRAFFRLHNTGAPVELDVGFPLIYKGEAADFQIWIDGKPQTFEDREKESVSNAGGRERKYTQRWKLWHMSFSEDERHLVEVRYSNAPARSYSSVISTIEYPVCARMRTDGFGYDVQDFGYPKSVQLHKWLQIYSVKYILVTGSYWKGPIGRCRVEADIQQLETDSLLEVRPPAREFSAKQIVWEWQNIDPPNNVDITFIGASPRKTILPYLEKAVAQRPDDAILATTLKAVQGDFPNDKITQERQKNFVLKQDSK